MADQQTIKKTGFLKPVFLCWHLRIIWMIKQDLNLGLLNGKILT